MTKNQQPMIQSADGKRLFACFPVAVLAIILNKKEEILLLSHPNQPEGWQVVNGAMEASETALDAVLRETYEEVGKHVQVRPLGTVHVSTFYYDENVPDMLSIAYLLAYEGGTIQPGDDMEGSEYRWLSLRELEDEKINIIIPPGELWMISRAIDLYKLWRNDNAANQPGFNRSVRGK